MNGIFDLVIRGGQVVSTEKIERLDIGIRDGRIAAIGQSSTIAAKQYFDARGLHLLPGVIDSQVHFREPGLEHKEDLETGTRAAVLGGVIGVFEMPNTKPPTTTRELLRDKLARAKGRAWCDHAFYVGASHENADVLGELEREPGAAGVKIFMGSSTGNLLVADDDTLRKILAGGHRRCAVHSEDEERLKERKALVPPGSHPRLHPVWRDAECAARSTGRLLRLALETRRKVHVLHVTAAEELALLRSAKDLATVECTPQHLTLVAPECYDRLGTYAQMNPPIRDERHRQALWEAIADGTVDVLGSDHAPHTREEKDAGYPATPSGMPGVQTLVPLMLDHVNAGRLSLQRFVDLTSAGPARVFGLATKGRIAIGLDADITAVDLRAERTITNEWIASRCGWTPFDGMKVKGWPIATIIRGQIVMRDDTVLGTPAGRPIAFAT